jgi:cellulose synthase (UDP-forming)
MTDLESDSATQAAGLATLIALAEDQLQVSQVPVPAPDFASSASAVPPGTGASGRTGSALSGATSRVVGRHANSRPSSRGTAYRPDRRGAARASSDLPHSLRRSRHRETSHRPVQLASIAIIISALWFTPWLVLNIDMAHPLSSVPFVCAFLYLVIQIHISIINNWHWSRGSAVRTPIGHEPYVGVIVPTCGEPTNMVRQTLMSIISQDWPIDRFIVIISDDAASDSMALMTRTLNWNNPRLAIHYHRPPKHGSPNRRGEAKAGNLNSALDYLRHEFPFVEFVETRDADDLVGDPSFLRRTVAVLRDDPQVAFTQTIKECYVSPGDPFNNQEQLFYKGVMRGRQAGNALFPCGSGLLWRRDALEDIGDFPSWNLVEDFQSGVEALKRGWRSAYVPIVGATAQHAPEDLGNVIKQKGTWALDSVRFLIWRSLKGMTFRQRLQFVDMGMFYFQGFPMLTLWITSIILVVQGRQPVVASQVDYIVHFMPYVIAVELFIWTMSREARVENILAFRRMLHGLMFVNMKAVFLALRYGPNRKPVYRVTRKSNIARWYWRETAPHFVILGAAAAAIVYGAAAHGITNILRPDTFYWLAITSFALGSFIPLGWYGLDIRGEIRSRLARGGHGGDLLRHHQPRGHPPGQLRKRQRPPQRHRRRHRRPERPLPPVRPKTAGAAS